MVHPVTTLKSAATNPMERNRIVAEMVQTVREQLGTSVPHLDRLVNSEQSEDPVGTEDPEAILDQTIDLGHESPTAINIGR